MALGVPGFVKVGAVIAGCALVAACTPEPGPTTTPVPSTASPTPSATPAETEIERQQRIDFEAAEEAYRASIAEQDRLASLGSAQSTPELQRTSTGQYLEFALQGLREFQDAGWRTVGSSDVVGVSPAGWQEGKLGLIACEDGSNIKIVDRTGRDVTPSARRTFVQDMTVIRVGGAWKVSSAASKPVKSFEGAPCAS